MYQMIQLWVPKHHRIMNLQNLNLSFKLGYYSIGKNLVVAFAIRSHLGCCQIAYQKYSIEAAVKH
jgi:hypothetical protein